MKFIPLLHAYYMTLLNPFLPYHVLTLKRSGIDPTKIAQPNTSWPSQHNSYVLLNKRPEPLTPTLIIRKILMPHANHAKLEPCRMVLMLPYASSDALWYDRRLLSELPRKHTLLYIFSSVSVLLVWAFLGRTVLLDITVAREPTAS